jgi:hypothetical protein
MQIWFFFDAGTGGDGIANLFERSSNVTSIDGLINYWRVHRIVDKKIKFYAANPDVNGCFRSVEHFDNKKNQLDPGYVSCVTTNKNCIITSHDVTLTALYNSDCQDIFCKDQIKVLLTLTDQNKSKINAAIKNLCAELNESVTFNTVDHSMFDIVLDVDKIQTDWQYVYDFSQSVGLDLDFQDYLEYQDLLKGNKTYMVNNFQVEEYESTICQNNITYRLIDVWQ